jgi:non-specific serine/threonine protein kinase
VARDALSEPPTAILSQRSILTVEAVRMIGQTISHYRVVERLGEGGMGVVYRAEDLRLGREVALKFLRPDVAVDARPLERLRLEARTASALNHPHICTVHDIDDHDGQSFIVMELLEGTTLRERLREGPLAPEAVVDAGVQISSALAAAHGKGIIHRDIKPGNVFLTQDGRIKVVDFGIAKLTQDPSGVTTSVHGLALALTDRLDAGLTPVGAPVGTVAYMSPEQLRGEELDPRTDVFSVGVVL